MTRTCVECEHLVVIAGQPAFSDATPGSEMEIRCDKKVWELNVYQDGETNFRQKMLAAQVCPHYLPTRGFIQR